MIKANLRAALLATAFLTPAPGLALAQPAQPAAPRAGTDYVKFEHADWTRNATLYQINTRQFTRAGCLRA